MKHGSKRRLTFGIIGGALALALVGWIVYAKSKPAPLETITAAYGNIAQEVLVTGRVKPTLSADLAFELGGKISRVFADVGTSVFAGQALAELDTADLSVKLLEAQAGVQSQQARLAGLERGTRPEEISIREASLTKARGDLASYYLNVSGILRDAYAKADDAVRAKTDAMFTNDDTISPQLSFNVIDSQSQVDATSMRLSSGYELVAWNSELDAISASSSPADLDAAIAKAQGHTRAVSDFLTRLLVAVNNASSLTPTLADTYKTNISAARTSVNTALSSLDGIQQTLLSQKNVVATSERELDLARAGSTPDEIAAQQALVKQAEAQEQSIRVQIAKSTLRSPINGIVTRQDAKSGQIASPNVTLVSVISEKTLEIEANVPEVDVGRVAAGNEVTITLDAFPGETFSGRVTYVDPGETIIDGVVNFKVKVVFDLQDPRIKTGLTANLTIETLKKSNVVVIPQFAVIENDEGTFVRKVVGGKATENEPVKLGIRGQDGQVEVVSGVASGDLLVNIGVKAK